MKFNKSYSLKEIADIIQATFIGPANFPVLGMNEIHVVEPGDIVFVDHPKYYDKALHSAASTILINKEVDCPEGKALLLSEDPFRDFNKLTQYFRAPVSWMLPTENDLGNIGEGTKIGPGTHIGSDVQIGKNCIIHPNVTIGDNCILGDGVVIQSGTVIGSDAFYYKKRPTGYDRLQSGGRVVLEDDVELGALCTIDRGVTGDTIIGKGSKLDNQVHVGHDTRIGSGCLIASQTGIAGCVIVENDVILWGQVGVASAVTIGRGAVVLGQTGVTKSIEGSRTYFGTPIEEARERFKQLAALRNIPQIFEQLKKQ
jgi:UDP-3-O-[3-hydroxymyristoyl] glucosamine N-acyltransferase